MRRRSGAVKAVGPGMVLGGVLLRDDQTDFATRKGRPTRLPAATPLMHDSPAESFAVEPKRRVIRPRRDEQMVESVGCHFVVAPRSARRPHENNTRARAMAPGTACTQRIFRFAVAAPNIPARVMHARKKILIESPGAPRTRPHTSPAARKPLYRP